MWENIKALVGVVHRSGCRVPGYLRRESPGILAMQVLSGAGNEYLELIADGRGGARWRCTECGAVEGVDPAEGSAVTIDPEPVGAESMRQPVRSPGRPPWTAALLRQRLTEAEAATTPPRTDRRVAVHFVALDGSKGITARQLSRLRDLLVTLTQE